MTSRKLLCNAALFAGALLLAAALPAMAQGNSGSKGFAVNASDSAGEKEVGLPIYPGARRHKDQGDSSSAFQMGAWGNDSGFKLVVVKLEVDAPPADVAAFYRKALAKYGKVLDCSQPAPAKEPKAKSKQLTCDNDHARPGELVYQSGTREQKHVVGIQHEGPLTLFQLVYVEQRGVDDDQ